MARGPPCKETQLRLADLKPPYLFPDFVRALPYLCNHLGNPSFVCPFASPVSLCVSFSLLRQLERNRCCTSICVRGVSVHTCSRLQSIGPFVRAVFYSPSKLDFSRGSGAASLKRSSRCSLSNCGWFTARAFIVPQSRRSSPSRAAGFDYLPSVGLCRLNLLLATSVVYIW